MSEKEPPMPRRYAVDFDNTLSDTAWNGEEFKMGSALPDIIKAVNECAKTNEIIIFTARPFAEWEHMRDWLRVHRVKYNGIQTKPLAIAYVDDKAMKPQEFVDIFNPREPQDHGDYDNQGNKF